MPDGDFPVERRETWPNEHHICESHEGSTMGTEAVGPRYTPGAVCSTVWVCHSVVQVLCGPFCSSARVVG